jgi:radical SAM superfamily enzyme YgiQ (UPF0313 family)
VSFKKGILLLNIKRPVNGLNSGPLDCLGLFYLAAVLENKGYDPWVFHGLAGDAPDVIEKNIKEKNIGAIGFSCDYQNRTAVEELCRFVKSKYDDIAVIAGGPQTVALGSEFLKESKCDYIVRGEAEETLPELLDYIVCSKGDITQIKGVCRAGKDGSLETFGERQPIEDLDSLPLPAYHRAVEGGGQYGGTVFTGRGCPFSCAFCYQSNHKKKVRLRSIKSVIKEIESNLDKNKDLKYITVMDDTFTLNPQRVAEFCDEFKKLRKERNIVWYCEAHVRTLAKHPEMLKNMAEAGLLRLQIGVESGCRQILDIYAKNTTPEEIEFVVREAVKCKIPQIATNLIIGGPLESEKTTEETIAFAEKLLNIAPGVIDITTGFLRPYPGTAISKDPAAFGLKLSVDNEIKSFDDYPPVSVDGLSAEDIIASRVKTARSISKTMQRLLKENKITYATILSQYSAAREYGVTSMWYINVLKKNAFLDEYFRLISEGAAVRMAGVPEDELIQWRPQRTFEIWRIVDMRNGYPQIDGYVLSPLEFELLLHSSGKLTFSEVIDGLYEIFGDKFDDKNTLTQQVSILLKKFDSLYWTFFCKI